MNSTWHLGMSLLKSVIRIVGCYIAIRNNDFIIMAAFMIAAEGLGISEEFGDKR